MAAKDETRADCRERVNHVLFHVEARLGESMTLEELARVARFSPFHSHRIFAAFTGESLAAFIRRLRPTPSASSARPRGRAVFSDQPRG